MSLCKVECCFNGSEEEHRNEPDLSSFGGHVAWSRWPVNGTYAKGQTAADNGAGGTA
jgi:hypothetical protein